MLAQHLKKLCNGSSSMLGAAHMLHAQAQHAVDCWIHARCLILGFIMSVGLLPIGMATAHGQDHATAVLSWSIMPTCQPAGLLKQLVHTNLAHVCNDGDLLWLQHAGKVWT